MMSAVPGHRDVALEALRRYEVSPQSVRLAAESFNSVFRVTTASAAYALRVGAVSQIHPEGTAAVEAAWHRRLREQGVCVPDVVPNVDGDFATLIPDGQAHRPRACILFDWVAGRSLRGCVTERRSAALGRLSARLQEDAAAWSPPGAESVLLANRVLYWQLPERLSVAGPRFGFGTLFVDALARAQAVVDTLWQSPQHPPHLVHGDLSPQNVIVSRLNGLVPIDFQDTVRGFELQDPSITVTALRRWPHSDRLVEAFRRGGLHQMNLTLNLADINRLESYAAAHAARVQAWMRCPSGL